MTADLTEYFCGGAQEAWASQYRQTVGQGPVDRRLCGGEGFRERMLVLAVQALADWMFDGKGEGLADIEAAIARLHDFMIARCEACEPDGGEAQRQTDAMLARTRPVPAVPLDSAVTHDEIACLDCGWKGKGLKRHIGAAHGLTPEQYRQRWSLPGNYPTTAPGYSEKRAEIARTTGLGKSPHKRQRLEAAE